MTANQIAYQAYLETQRANRAREAENTRSNQANETIKSGTLHETTRANKAKEAELYRHNLKSEAQDEKRANAAIVQASGSIWKNVIGSVSDFI